MTITAPVIRYHGGKCRLAPWSMNALHSRGLPLEEVANA